jgi:hypothetical protein
VIPTGTLDGDLPGSVSAYREDKKELTSYKRGRRSAVAVPVPTLILLRSCQHIARKVDRPMSASDYISAIALIGSLVATAVAFIQANRITALSRRPILAIQYDGSIERWVVRNVGYGPAFNVVIAQQKEDGDESWYNPVGLPTIPKDQSFTLEWLGGDYGTPTLACSLGVRYADFLDKHTESRHFAYTRYDRCFVYPPNQLPSWIMPAYTVGEVRRYWEKGLPRELPS